MSKPPPEGAAEKRAKNRTCLMIRRGARAPRPRARSWSHRLGNAPLGEDTLELAAVLDLLDGVVHRREQVRVTFLDREAYLPVVHRLVRRHRLQPGDVVGLHLIGDAR